MSRAVLAVSNDWRWLKTPERQPIVDHLLGDGVPLYHGSRVHRFDAEHLGRLGETLQLRLTKRSDGSAS